MEMGTQIFSQFPVVSNFFHSFLWSLVIQHLKDFKGSCPHHSTMFPAWRHNRMVTLVTTAEEVSPAHSRAKKHLGWHRREAGIQKGVLYFPFFPLLFRFIDKTKEHQKKKKRWNMISPCTCHPATNPSTWDSAAFIYSPSASSLPHDNGNLSRQIFAMMLFHP